MLAENADECGYVRLNRRIVAEEFGEREMSPIRAVPPRKEEVRHAPRVPGVGTGHVDEAVERVLCGRFAERSFVHVHGSSALNATASFGARAAAMAKRSASAKSDSRRTSRRGYTRCIDLSWGEDMIFVPF